MFVQKVVLNVVSYAFVPSTEAFDSSMDELGEVGHSYHFIRGFHCTKRQRTHLEKGCDSIIGTMQHS
jgi:hypothetical protein